MNIIRFVFTKDKYIGITIETNDSKLGFYTGDPIEDWKQMVAFTQNHPGSYATTSSFEEFVWAFPEYKFIENENGAEVLVRA